MELEEVISGSMQRKCKS